jgi:FkbM family methyltransferase
VKALKSLKRLIPRKFKTQLRDTFGHFLCARRSYSQEGEDLVIQRLFDRQVSGFYVDVGCHHPYRFSNTYSLYQNGWFGVCIDPLPGVAKLFRKHRPKDIVVQAGVAKLPATLTYFRFSEPALNTFDKGLAMERDGQDGQRIIGRDEVQCDTLARILARYLPSEQEHIDLMSIDVEGFDLEVLQSNDWHRYQPKVIIAECLGLGIHELQNDALATFLEQRGYRAYSKLVHSVIFVHSSVPEPTGSRIEKAAADSFVP